jgi:rhodanese-related sulfurtransferase
MATGRLSRPCVLERGRGTVTTMNLLTRWFRRSPAAPSWIEAAALVKRREQDATLLILDVRGPDEFTGPLGHIAGATNLPLNDLSERLPELVRKDRPVVVVCKTDRRSSIAADQLRKAGVADVSVLRGGTERWRELGLPDSSRRHSRKRQAPSNGSPALGELELLASTCPTVIRPFVDRCLRHLGRQARSSNLPRRSGLPAVMVCIVTAPRRASLGCGRTRPVGRGASPAHAPFTDGSPRASTSPI